MQELKVIGVEDGALLVASEDGSRYRVAVDASLQARLRSTSATTGAARKLSPREIQAHIRSGMSAEDVAAVTGASLDYVQRFEGPVLAEREFVIESALNVPVHTALELNPATTPATFGSVIRQRLVDAGAINERWASWKEEGGEWIVKLTFLAEQVEHDARWTYEPKKQALVPANPEAVSLSQQGELPQPLIPRLRAVSNDVEATRFDSGAFEVETEERPALQETVALPPLPRIGITEEPSARPTNQTADLLEALRRRRGQRDPMDPEHAASLAAHPSTGQVKLVDIPLDPSQTRPVSASGSPSAGQAAGSGAPQNSGSGPNGLTRGSRRGRASMPSWDEIVFGSRTDDEN